MHFAIIGTGAMGLLTGALLASSGQDVTMISAGREDMRDALRARGIHYIGSDGTRDIPVAAFTADEIASSGAPDTPFDFVFLFTKSTGSRAALERCRPIFGPDTYLVTLQNGLGNMETAAEFAAPGHTIGGIVSMPAAVTGVGEVTTGSADHVSTVGFAPSEPGGPAQDPAAPERLAEAMNRAGIQTKTAPDIRTAIWGKVALNSAFNPVSALARVPQSGFLADEDGEAMILTIMNETLDLAEALGIHADREASTGRARRIMRTHAGHYPSMAQDVLAGRETEIEGINGEIVRRARAIGFPVPHNETLYVLVKLLQAGYLGK